MDGLHIDLVRAPEQLAAFADYDKVLSAGVIDGRNVWRANLNQVLDVLEPLKAKLGERYGLRQAALIALSVWDLSVEVQLKENKPELYNWLAFTLQKYKNCRYN